MQRWATTRSGAKRAYSTSSASATANSTFSARASRPRRLASSMAPGSRSIPITRRHLGAMARARGPWPVPTSRAVADARGSASRRASRRGLTRDGTFRGRRDQAGVLRHHTPRIPRPGRLDILQAPLQLCGRELHIQLAFLDVDGNRVTVLQGRDRAPLGGLGGDVADHEAVGGSREAAVGHQGHGVPEARALDGAGDVEHLAHAGAALWAFPADDHDVVCLDLSRLDRLEGILLAVEDPRRSPMEVALLAGDLGDAAVRGEIATEDDDSPLGLQRIVEGPNDLLSGGLTRRAGLFGDRPAGDGHLGVVQESR